MSGLRRVVVVLALLGAAGPLVAQTVDDRIEAALGHWRAASWYVRLGNTDVAALEAEAFREKWRAVGPAAPAGVAALAETVSLALETDDAATAGRTLGAIGDALAEARRTAGLSGFPEAMRSYRDAVERLTGMITMSEHRGNNAFDPGLKAEVRRATIEVRDQAAALAPATPPRWANDAKFHDLVRQNVDGIAAVLAAIDRPRPPASGLEVAGLISVARANYNLLFLSYGY